MAKLEFICNRIVSPKQGYTYQGLLSPFSHGTFKVLQIIDNCSYDRCYADANGDIDSTDRHKCTACIKAGTNYRVRYEYTSHTIKIRAQHRFKFNINYKLFE